jgi:hypothetical protein
VPCVDVAAVGLDRKAASVTLDLDILSLEEGEGHVPSARRPLAILAVTLARADRLTTKRESDRATKAATRSEWLFRHGMTFHLVERLLGLVGAMIVNQYSIPVQGAR